ncbi:hypothetical protein ACJ41O_012117 [Fusarium nematophilum]
MTQILRRPFMLHRELPARWVIVRDVEVFRVYMVAHHIAVDGQSMSIISRTFLDLLDNPDMPLPPGLQFCNAHMMEKASSVSPAYLNSKKVLLNQIEGKSTASWPEDECSTDGPSANFRDIDSWHTFSKAELDDLSKMYKTSWFRVVTSLVGLLVIDKKHLQHGRDEVISVGFGGRPKGMETCVGQFANALPVKMPLWKVLETQDGSFKSLVSAVGSNISAVKRAELVPALDVVQARRSLNLDSQLPNVAVTYSPKLAESGCCRLFPVEGSWDLFFCFLEYEDNVKLGVIYDSQKFSPPALSAMRNLFSRLYDLSKTDGTDLTSMLGWLPTHPSLPREPSTTPSNPLKHVHHWFDAHAETSPDALALCCAELGILMTYGELYSSSEKKARFLREKGVRRGGNVLIRLHRGFTVIEWVLAILKCGAAFVYLDPDSPTRQQEAVTGNSKPSVVVDGDLAKEETLTDVKSSTENDDQDEAETKFSTADDDLAYIIYTSGSTGEPKGVMVEHGSLAAFVRASTGVFEVGFGTRVLQLASFSFDASILEWTNALCTGACLCFAQHPGQLVGDYLAQVIEQNEVTFMQITPTALETLPAADHELPSLRQISVGGESPGREVLARWHRRVNLVNSYGPTEAAVAVCFNKIQTSDHLPQVVSVGRPASPETHVCVRAQGFGPVLRSGVEGEICISGPQVARGYCESPALTAGSFSVQAASGVRTYRTGDRGLMLPDGSILVKGRIDRELKVRGFRIAPEEVEAAILDARVGALEASVQVSHTGLELLGFVAPGAVSPRALLDALARVLPGHKIPSRIYTADGGLPRNSNGKTDHKAVRGMIAEYQARDASRMLDQTSFEDPNLPSAVMDLHEPQETVSGIWQDVLGLSSSPPTGVNFFDIGGHSLLVPKLHQKLKAAFPSSPVRLVDLFHKSTVNSQALLFSGTETRHTPRALLSQATSAPPSRSKTQAPPSSESVSSTGSETPVTGPSSSRTSISEPPRPQPSQGAVAIVGMAGRFPGASNVNDFYDLLAQGRSGIRAPDPATERHVLPGNRWVSRAGTLDNIEDFDHEFWNLGEDEATEMDPQQRLFLEVAHEALFDAGIDSRKMPSDGIVGVFVGSANPAYHLHTESVATDSFLRENRGFVAPSISARVAYHLDLRGPNMTIQTNCASSTIALSQACDAIRLGQCDMAIVGGVSVQLYDGGYITKDGQIFSPRGECNPFDSRADGTVPGDAVTAIVLKRHSAAVEDNTPVYATILGTAIGSDGALDKAGYQVPSPRGQAAVIRSAWDLAGLDPANLRYAELHGSGTPIGDALELQGLGLAINEMGRVGDRPQVTVGSTKGNIGNTQHSSGLVSLIKLCKSMQAGLIPATRGLEQPNEMIDPALPITLASRPVKLSFGDILAVSAAGWGGVSSHVVLAFPEESHLFKRSTALIPASTFNRKPLQAPRLSAQTGESQLQVSTA